MVLPAEHDPGACAAPSGSGEPSPLQVPPEAAAQDAAGMAPGATPQESQLVFVYGTLKRQQRNHHWLEGASWQGESEVHGVVMHDLGPFPMAVIGEGTAHGEVYAVAEGGLLRLDALEGYPRLYDRQRLCLSDGRLAWVYLGRPHQVRHAPVVASGCWLPVASASPGWRAGRTAWAG